jgi:uncharacterized OsmC-like protein
LVVLRFARISPEGEQLYTIATQKNGMLQQSRQSTAPGGTLRPHQALTAALMAALTAALIAALKRR